MNMPPATSHKVALRRLGEIGPWSPLPGTSAREGLGISHRIIGHLLLDPILRMRVMHQSSIFAYV
ncbi:hypothetical protein LL969_09255 [Xanthomonas campestris pv. phormiicola]|nr:hypothetical protein [Xanthomonas campestris pv. phormiicola]